MTADPPSNEDSDAISRITPRYEFEARVAIRTQAGITIEGWTRDISESGLGAFVGRGIGLGDSVTLTFHLSPSVRLSVPAQVVVADGTRYGFRFTALSAEQRANILGAVKSRREIEAGGLSQSATVHRYRPEHLMPQQEAGQPSEISFADRARTLIKRGYAPKVAVELVLHDIEAEHGQDSRITDKARIDAEEFLLKIRRGLI